MLRLFDGIAAQLAQMKDGRRVSVAGLVLIRQRPGTAKGVVFMTLEDETGIANIVVWRDVFEANRRLVMTAGFLVVHGQVQSVDGVVSTKNPLEEKSVERPTPSVARTHTR